MKLALDEAKLAYSKKEVPVGAVLVKDDEVISRSYNQSISKKDPSGHAEMNVLRDAANKLDNYRLNGASLYVTLEPCLMCLGALQHARVERVVYGAHDPKQGVLSQASPQMIPSAFEVESGVLATESADLLKRFFEARR